eukprot:scaffold44544_cov62-Attheya_sp.AAC.5
MVTAMIGVAIAATLEEFQDASCVFGTATGFSTAHVEATTYGRLELLLGIQTRLVYVVCILRTVL